MCAVFPWAHRDGQPSPIAIASGCKLDSESNVSPHLVYERAKVRSIVDKRFQLIQPKGGNWSWFGWHMVDKGADAIIICEGELDAMACHQATGWPAISMPNGASSLPIDLLPSLEQFNRIYLWMDNDVAGQEGARKFVQKLGMGRTMLIKPLPNDQNSPKDANDALRDGSDMRAMIMAAAPIPHEQITTFHQLRDEIKRELLQPIEYRGGIGSMTLPSFNKILKGHRKGELSIYTGPTGVGKTTILSQLSLDFCMSGVVTLWGSFEIKNNRLARTMLSQLACKNFAASSDALSDFDFWADQFEQLPMYFLRYFGSTSVEQVLDAMEYAVYAYDVEHVVLDNLQFMLSGQAKPGYDKFDTQDRALDLLRQFATTKNVHISLVCHPRKEADSSTLSIASVFGSAKVTQEADNVIIIQGNSIRTQGENDVAGYSDVRSIEVRKNRFDGQLGVFDYRYDKSRCRIVEFNSENMDRAHVDIGMSQSLNSTKQKRSRKARDNSVPAVLRSTRSISAPIVVA